MGYTHTGGLISVSAPVSLQLCTLEKDSELVVLLGHLGCSVLSLLPRVICCMFVAIWSRSER